MMRFVTPVVILACMAAGGNLYAEPAAEKDEVASPPEKHSPPVRQGPRPAEKPATSFRPSEKIGADSAVSFPVDI